MKKLVFNLAPQVEKQLNNFQIDFIKLAYDRMATIEELLDMEKSAQVRFLYIKELYVIFEELNKIKFEKNLDPSAIGQHNEIFNLLNTVVGFIRNVLSHFPLFNTWDEVWISQDFSTGMGGSLKGKIYRFLEEDKSGISKAFRLTWKDDSVSQFVLKFPSIKSSDQKVYLKDILPEKEGALSVIALMSHLF